MKESIKWCIKACCCIPLFVLSGIVGLFFANNNLIIMFICAGGLFHAFGYGLYSMSKMQSAERLERYNEMLDENEEYYQKMNQKHYGVIR